MTFNQSSQLFVGDQLNLSQQRNKYKDTNMKSNKESLLLFFICLLCCVIWNYWQPHQYHMIWAFNLSPVRLDIKTNQVDNRVKYEYSHWQHNEMTHEWDEENIENNNMENTTWGELYWSLNHIDVEVIPLRRTFDFRCNVKMLYDSKINIYGVHI